VNLTKWAHARGIHVTTAYRWYREGALPVLARKTGRLILVSPDTAAAASPQGGAGLYARVSSRWTIGPLAALTAASAPCVGAG
jgi:putative resolvase